MEGEKAGGGGEKEGERETGLYRGLREEGREEERRGEEVAGKK